MKAKKILSLICALAMLCSFSMTSAFAAGNVATTTPVSAEASSTTILNSSVPATLDGINLDDVSMLHSSEDAASFTLESNARSSTSITETFDGVLEATGENAGVQCTLREGQIIYMTLTCPVNPNLNYDLYLCTVESDNTLTPIAISAFPTYMDPNTGKTLDETLSYVHTEDAPGEYAVVVISSEGGGTEDDDVFFLTVSIDEPGTYESAEPNDYPGYASPLSIVTSGTIRASGSGALTVANDQDWFTVTVPTRVVFQATAGDYNIEVYSYDTSSGILALATRSPSGHYVLDAGSYFVRVYSDDAIEEFVPGSYAILMVDQSLYTTFATAYDYGYWLYHNSPTGLPWGQAQAFYRFTIDDGEGVYAKINVPDDGSVVRIDALNSQGVRIARSTSENASSIVTPSNGYSSPFIAVDIDSTDVTDGIVYLQVVYGNPNTYHSSPFIAKRLYTGFGEFSFSGTCSNPGNSYSNIITLDLRNNSQIPEGAILSGVSTHGSISPSVGGVNHLIQPGSMGWAISNAVGGGTGYYPDIDESYGIAVKNVWQFQYMQTAFASTKMTNISIEFEWIEDIRFNNYELYN